MTKINLKKKEGASIINALFGGVVPRLGLKHITVGRTAETQTIVDSLENVKNGNSEMRFWIGNFGSGKSFILQLIETFAIQTNFVVTTLDFTPETRMYANDGKARALYNKIINNIVIQTDQDGNAIATILDQWIEKVMEKVAISNNIAFADLHTNENQALVRAQIIETTRSFSSVGGYEFSQAIAKYHEGYSNADPDLQRQALRWLKGEYTAKTDSLKDLGIREIINDQNYYDMIKNFTQLFVELGYKGFVINLDEAVNLYKISQRPPREKNYEKILSIYNDCLQGGVENLFINIGGTLPFLEDDQRGLFSYQALKTRLSASKYETDRMRDMSQPVIRLSPLTHEELYVLLTKLKDIFETYHETEIECTKSDITRFLEVHLNKIGADQFITPRDVIRDFIQLLSMKRQNPDKTIKTLLDKESSENSYSDQQESTPIEVY